MVQLQFGNQSVSTKSLTQSFGWTSLDAFTQHDVQELNRILSDKLEEKMKVCLLSREQLHSAKEVGLVGECWFQGLCRFHSFIISSSNELDGNKKSEL